MNLSIIYFQSPSSVPCLSFIAATASFTSSVSSSWPSVLHRRCRASSVSCSSPPFRARYPQPISSISCSISLRLLQFYFQICCAAASPPQIWISMVVLIAGSPRQGGGGWLFIFDGSSSPPFLVIDFISIEIESFIFPITCESLEWKQRKQDFSFQIEARMCKKKKVKRAAR